MPRRTRLAVFLVAGSLIAGSLPVGVGMARTQTPAQNAFVDRPLRDAQGRVSALVHVKEGVPLQDGLLAAHRAGAQLGSRYEAINVFVAYGTSDVFRTLARSPLIEALEANRRLRTFTETSHVATRGQEVLEGAVTLPDGTVIDGSGIGVAVVDSGVDGTHPDLVDRMGGNVKIVCPVPGGGLAHSAKPFVECLSPKAAVPMDDTDHPSGGGHGTHVAGTVAGTGAASDGRYHGAAPGATLYGVSVGTALVVENALDGLAWVLENHDLVTPSIRVVNNSWGSNHAKYDPQNGIFHKAIWKLQEELIAEGVTVVFAAGNSGGNGSTATTGGECVNPTPGLICVANYNDGNSGRRDGSIDSTSSRGIPSDPGTWPDLAAPGTQITATCRVTLPVCNAHFGIVEDPPNSYATLSGTSMAAPHVAGIVAQVLQASPSMTPAMVEDLLEDTAHKFVWGAAYTNDPFNGDDLSSYEKGHGLVDVVAAVRAAMGAPTPDPTPTGEPTPTPTPTTTTPPGTATRYYFHTSAWLNNTADKAPVSPGAPFDETPPTIPFFSSTATDVPIAGNVTGQQLWDPSWTGSVAQAFDEVNFDFWVKAPEEEIQTGTLEVDGLIFVGERRITLPTFMAEVGAVDAPVHVTNTVTTMLNEAGEEVPLSVDPAGQPVSVVLRGHWTANSVGFTILYDSTDYPSGFSVKLAGTTASPSPTTSPTPTASPTQPPPPSGSRGVYPEVPNDPYFPDSSDLFEPQQWGPQIIQAPQAWQMPRATGHGIKVAVLDSGVDLQHEDLQCPGKLEVAPGSDVMNDGNGPDDVNGHGSHVAGIIGACTNNGIGVAGVAPDTTILPFQIFGADGSGSTEAIAEGIRRATDAGAHVINMSLSLGVGALPAGGGFLGWVPGIAPEIDEAIDYANAAGVVVVAAAGNDSLPLCEYPAFYQDVVCVGATDNRDLKSWYSGFPNKANLGPSVTAPGGSEPVFCDVPSESIYSIWPVELNECPLGEETSYRAINGTSMATPHAAGVAALIYDRLGGQRSAANRAAAVDALISSAADLGAPGYDPVYGNGRVDAFTAVNAITVVEPTPTETTPAAAATSTSFTDGSAETGQYSDDARIAARLVEAVTGNPIVGETLTFTLTGEAGAISWDLVTDAEGVASDTLDLDGAPGSYTLTVAYGGREDVYLASGDVTGFQIERDDSETSLSVAGKGGKRRLTATVVDADAATGLEGRTVVFFADGVEIGSAVTNAQGVAAIDRIPEEYRGARFEFVARFPGDDLYTPSSGTAHT